MLIKDWMQLVNYRITEGTDYGWNCYGHHAYQLDSWNGDFDGHSFSIIFDTKTQVVYEVQAHDYKNNRAYRWSNPEFKEKFQEEALEKNSLEKEAWEDVNYVDLEVEEDWLTKAEAIYHGLPYDERVVVPIDFTDEELLKYMKLAHEKDMTFNQFVEEALRAAIEEYKRDPEGMKQRAKDFTSGE